MRNAFIEHLIERAKEDPDIFLVVGDLGYTVVDPFVAQCPDRFINAGVAEQNMTAVACGLAREGFKVFTYSIGNFATLRCLEQIRNDVCYHDLPVCVVTVGGGFMYGSLGPSHHLTEDIGIMRTLPNMRVFVPFSRISAHAALDEVLENPGPAYIRLGREDLDVSEVNGNGITPVLEQTGGAEAYLVVGQIETGLIERARDEKRDVFALCRVKPLPTEDVDQLLARYSKIIVVEDHQRFGGVRSILSEHTSAIGSIAIDDSFATCVGKEKDLRRTMLTRPEEDGEESP